MILANSILLRRDLGDTLVARVDVSLDVDGRLLELDRLGKCIAHALRNLLGSLAGSAVVHELIEIG